MAMTDQEVVKLAWPEAESAWPNGIWNLKGKGAFRLGWDWHEARQHPSMVEWEKTHSFFIGAVDILTAQQATIAEQAARIAASSIVGARWVTRKFFEDQQCELARLRKREEEAREILMAFTELGVSAKSHSAWYDARVWLADEKGGE